MSTTEEWKEAGYLEYRELVERVATERRVSVETYKLWLVGPLSKIRAMLIDHCMIVLPDDREWACLYSPELVGFLLAYVSRQNSGVRFSVAACVRFYEAFWNNDEAALMYLTPRQRSRFLDTTTSRRRSRR